jgi:hypothetical protein
METFNFCLCSAAFIFNPKNSNAFWVPFKIVRY